MHAHRCSHCGTIWRHADRSRGNAAQHTCPRCGRLEWWHDGYAPRARTREAAAIETVVYDARDAYSLDSGRPSRAQWRPPQREAAAPPLIIISGGTPGPGEYTAAALKAKADRDARNAQARKDVLDLASKGAAAAMIVAGPIGSGIVLGLGTLTVAAMEGIIAIANLFAKDDNSADNQKRAASFAKTFMDRGLVPPKFQKDFFYSARDYGNSLQYALEAIDKLPAEERAAIEAFGKLTMGIGNDVVGSAIGDDMDRYARTMWSTTKASGEPVTGPLAGTTLAPILDLVARIAAYGYGSDLGGTRAATLAAAKDWYFNRYKKGKTNPETESMSEPAAWVKGAIDYASTHATKKPPVATSFGPVMFLPIGKPAAKPATAGGGDVAVPLAAPAALLFFL